MKLLVLDKCVFHGTRESCLTKFVGEYHVLLPHALAIECLVSDDCNAKKKTKAPILLLSRVETLVKAGAWFARSSVAMHREETRGRCAAVQIIDEQTTQGIRAGTLVLTEDYVRCEADACRKAFDPLIKPVRELGCAFVAAIKEKDMVAGFQEEIREMCDVHRFERNLQVASRTKDEILQKLIPSVASDVTEAWYTWQVIRLWYGWAIEWAAKRADMDDATLPSDISNDFYDMEYVASLSMANGLLTKDKRLVEPLARAAFPERDVYSSLEEVPDSYRCDWTGD